MTNHRCFGCSPSNSFGLQMEFFIDGDALFSWVIVPDHLCGWDRLVHGGVISTLLDEIMSWSAITLLKRIILTKSMKVDFIRPVFVGHELTVEGRMLERTGERESLMAGFLYNDKKELCAKAEGTFALFTPKAAIRMGIMDEENVREIRLCFNV